MQFELSEANEILSRTPEVLRTMLAGLPEPWVRNNYGEKTFSPFDVVGHLIHGERADWIPRVKIILEHDERKAFEPFDRYAMYEESKGKSLGELLDTFAALRRENITQLRKLITGRDRLALRGTHPALGTVTMEQLLATWVAHDLNHIAQICKAMAFQYAERVGPWREYLSILRPPVVRAN